MTPSAQRKSLEYALMVAGAVATMFFSLGLARRELDGKEDQAAHERDITRLRNEIAIQAVRDSADRAETRRILLDLACDVSPKRCPRGMP